MSDKYDGQPITAPAAAEFALYAMLASNCYHHEDREVFKVEKLGWVLQKKEEHGVGLAYDIYRNTDTGHVIWAFRGTDSVLDYFTANFGFIPSSLVNQYTKAREVFAEYVGTRGTNNLAVCGHSLGGGLALSMSVRYGVPAFTFNSSPRIFDGLGDNHEPAQRVVVYQNGEILQKIRKRYPKIKAAVPEASVYKCSFNFGNHRADKLARGLLEMGANPGLKPLL